MPIPLGILAVAGAGGGGAASDYQLIQTQVISGNPSSVTFSSIPSTFKHLQLRVVTKMTSVVGFTALRMNNDSGTNYMIHRLLGNSGGVQSGAIGGQTNLWAYPSDFSTTANIFSAAVIDILDYANTSKNKTMRSLGGLADGSEQIALISGLWMNTAAINSLTLIAPGTTFANNSRMSLYGIK